MFSGYVSGRKKALQDFHSNIKGGGSLMDSYRNIGCGDVPVKSNIQINGNIINIDGMQGEEVTYLNSFDIFVWLRENYNYTTKAKPLKIYKINQGLGKLFFIMSDRTTIMVYHGSGLLYTHANFSKL